jgi:hypothetical protein
MTREILGSLMSLLSSFIVALLVLAERTMTFERVACTLDATSSPNPADPQGNEPV